MDKRKATDPAPTDNAREEKPVKKARAKYDEPPSDSESQGNDDEDENEESDFEEDEFDDSEGVDDLDALSEPEVEPSSRRTRNRNVDYKKLSEDLDQEKDKKDDDDAEEEFKEPKGAKEESKEDNKE